MPGLLGHNKPGSAWASGERIYQPLREIARIKSLVAVGKTPLLSHKPEFQGRSMQDVAAGRADAELEKLRDALDAAIPDDYPFWLTLYHEPENDTGSFSAAVFRQATVRFVTRVTRRIPGARSAICMMHEVYNEPGQPWESPIARKADHPYDPGADYVDLYAGDPYNPYRLEPTYKWRELSWLAGPMVGYAAARGRPAGVWETGSQDDARKPQWIKNAGVYARDAKMPHLTFFHGTGPRGSWDAESDDECVEQLAALARRKSFQR